MIELIILGAGLLIGYAIHRAISKWQPMESAPRDGTKIIIYQGGQEWLASWNEEKEDFMYLRFYLLCPEKWRPVTKFD